MIKSNPSAHQYLSFQRSTPLPSDLTRLQSLQKKQQSLWQSIRQNVSDAKKQFKKLNEQLKDELLNKLRIKGEVVEEILRTLDSKIEFVIESCEKYGMRIMQHVSGGAGGKGGVDEGVVGQAYNQRFELVTEKMRVLEQRLYGFKQNEEELKSRVEVLKERNNQLSEEYRVLTVRSNERISQLEQQIREKEHHLKEKTDELRKKETNEAIKFTFVHPSPAPAPQQPAQQMPVIQTQQPQPQVVHKTKSQQSSGVAHYNPQVIQPQPQQQQQPHQHQHQTKKQNVPKTIMQQHTPIQYQPKPIQAQPPPQPQQPFSDNNSIQIRPDFFRNNTESSTSKGINLRSIREQNLMSARKPLRQNESEVSESQYNQRGNYSRETGRNEQHDHRFDYLMSNLVGTQADSSNPHMTTEESRMSRMSGYQSSYMHR